MFSTLSPQVQNRVMYPTYFIIACNVYFFRDYVIFFGHKDTCSPCERANMSFFQVRAKGWRRISGDMVVQEKQGKGFSAHLLHGMNKETKFLRIKHTPCTCTEYLSKSFKLQTKGSKTHLKSPKKQLLGSSKMKNYNTPKIFPKNA